MSRITRKSTSKTAAEEQSAPPVLVDLEKDPAEAVLGTLGLGGPREAALQWLREGFSVAFYQNEALDHSELGRVAALKIGGTYKEPPPNLPDTRIAGTGWKYQLKRLLKPEDIKS